jgi:hypothetical protein
VDVAVQRLRSKIETDAASPSKGAEGVTRIAAFEERVEDGPPINMVDIPVTLMPLTRW